MRPRNAFRLLLLLFILVLSASGCLFFPKRTAPVAADNRPGAIQGTIIYMHTGQPAPGVSVSLLEGAMVAVTDAQGHFSFPSLPAGWQTLYARKDGFITSGTSVDLASAQTQTVSFMLQPEEGHLHGMSGRVPDLCGSCHVLHGQQFVKGTENDTCYQCHQSTYPRLSTQGIYNQTLHSAGVAADSPSPVTLTLGGQARGDCSNCHEAHGINNSHRHLLRVTAPSASNVLCYTCHTAPGTGHTKDYPGQTACEASDNPHMNPLPSRVDLLAAYPESEAEPGECYNCHNPHGATLDGTQTGPLTTAMTRKEEGALCVVCHTYLNGPLVQSTKHSCSLCHNPHKVKQGGVRMVKKTGVATGELVPVTTYKTGSHRGAVNLLPNSYCLGCHNNTPGNPYAGRAKVPNVTNTSFKNITTGSLPDSRYRDLHNVHIDGPIGDDDGRVLIWGYWAAGGGTRGPRYYCYPGGYHEDKGAVPKTPENKVWCVDCHDVHPNPATAGNQRGRLLRTALITRATVTTNINGTGYDGKNSCGMNTVVAKCHAGSSPDGKYNGCDWCHTSAGSPGYSCLCGQTCPSYSGGGTNGSGGSSGFSHGTSHPNKGAGTPTRPTVVL